MSPADTAAIIAKLSPPPPPGAPYALPIPGSERPDRTPVYRHWRFRDAPLLEYLEPTGRTFHDLFEVQVKYKGDKKCLGWRPWNPATRSFENKYVWMTYGEVAEKRKNFGAGIVELHKRLGITADKYGVGLWSKNCPEWQISELALVSQSLWSVSLYETLGPEAGEYIINHGELTCIVCSAPHIPTLLKLAPRVPTLKLIISLDPLDAGEPAGLSKLALLNKVAKEHGIEVFSMADAELLGARSGRPMRPPQKEDIITVNYTSGTTGNPKGVVLTHGNMVAAISSARSTGDVSTNDVVISYLPSAHIYGRMIDQLALSEGARIGYCQGDITKLVDDMKLLRPTAFMSVPRLYNRFSSAIQAGTIEAPGFKGALSRHVVSLKKASMKLPPGRATNKHLLYDAIWTSKVAKNLGLERCRSMVSGSAQLDPDVQVFLRAALGNKFFQGWGMTETYAVGTTQFTDDYSVSNIGAPNPGVEICIESVPELEYCVSDKPRPRGEMLVRGPIVLHEYYKNPEETQRTIEPDGWFHTGDIVEVDELGRFKIIDRKKNVLKLAQGEYISPERLENVYMGSSNLVAMAYVHGDPTEATLVGVFGVDPEHFAPFASRILGKPVSPQDLQAIKAAGQDPRVRRAFLKEMDDIGRRHKFNSYERVRAVYLDVEPFSMDNELLTPTLKLKRPQTANAFRKQIDAMYAEIKADAATKPKPKL